MRSATLIRDVAVGPLDVPMSEPFAIAGGSTDSVRNALVRVRLADGSLGYGEAAPLAAFNGETQTAVLSAMRASGERLVGRDAGDWRPLLDELDRDCPSGAGRAALSMAVLDAFTRAVGLPLRRLFGGASHAVHSDVTVALVPPDQARSAARRIARLGVRTIKIKVGSDVGADEARVRAVAEAAPRAALLLDANQGFGPREAVELVRRLRARGIAPALFEQPVKKGDWEGLAQVHRAGRVRVAADESVATRADALELVRRGAAQVVNVKLMKSGVLESLEIALVCRAAGIGLMIGAMVESPLSMTAAAHLAAGLGGFEFVDLDTSLWLAEEPMHGVAFGRAGLYDLARVRAGIGTRPRRRFEVRAFGQDRAG